MLNHCTSSAGTRLQCGLNTFPDNFSDTTGKPQETPGTNTDVLQDATRVGLYQLLVTGTNNTVATLDRHFTWEQIKNVRSPADDPGDCPGRLQSLRLSSRCIIFTTLSRAPSIFYPSRNLVAAQLGPGLGCAKD